MLRRAVELVKRSGPSGGAHRGRARDRVGVAAQGRSGRLHLSLGQALGHPPHDMVREGQMVSEPLSSRSRHLAATCRLPTQVLLNRDLDHEKVFGLVVVAQVAGRQARLRRRRPSITSSTSVRRASAAQPWPGTASCRSGTLALYRGVRALADGHRGQGLVQVPAHRAAPYPRRTRGCAGKVPWSRTLTPFGC